MMFSNADVLEIIERSDIAGGTGNLDVAEADADVTVTSASGLQQHAPDSDKVVWIPGDAEIRLNETTTVRATIASDRSTMCKDSPGTGSPGALIYTTVHGKDSHAHSGGSGCGILQMMGSGRLTGVRLRGPYHDHYDDPEYPGYIPLDSGNSKERARKRAQRFARGVKIHSSDVEIDNCEIYGWPNQAIQMGSRNSDAFSPDIHHIYGHDCMMVGFGYVVDVMRGMPHIHSSYFNATRHSIDGFGYENGGYILERNVFGPSTYSHAVDMHMLGENGSNDSDPSSPMWEMRAGGRMEIRDNVFLFRKDIRGNNQECVVIRGIPKDACTVEENWMIHPEPPAENPGNSSPGHAWRQVNVTQSSTVETDQYGYTPNFIRRNNNFNLRQIRLPDGTTAASRGDKLRLATRIPNRRGKAAACRGIIDAIDGSTSGR